MAGLAAGSQQPRLDLNLDQVVDDADLAFLVEDLLGTSPADLNLDGQADSSDLLDFLAGWTGEAQPGQFEQGWRDGDRDGDGDVDSIDLLAVLEGWPAEGS
jgi:hypothetical protein